MKLFSLLILLVTAAVSCVTAQENKRATLADSGLLGANAATNFEPAKRLNWPDTSKAGGYAVATASVPDYANKAIWPNLTDKEPYLKETWPKVRTLTWAHPGQSAGGRAKLNPFDLANWKDEKGQPAKTPFDENTDLVLPASNESYEIAMTLGKNVDGFPTAARHVTVHAGAFLRGGGDGVGMTFTGNVWIKRFGRIYGQSATFFTGAKNTFYRNDNHPLDGKLDNAGRWQDVNRGSQYFTFRKPIAEGGSVEILGLVTVLDEFGVQGSKLVIGRDSAMLPGRNALPRITQGGVIALMDGAFFSTWSNSLDNPDLWIEDGYLQGGLPERPLTRPAYFGVNFKNHTASPPPADKQAANKREIAPRLVSVVIEKGGLRSYAATPAARLRMVGNGLIGRENHRAPPGSRKELSDLAKPSEKPYYEWYDRLPRTFDIYLGPGASLSDVAIAGLRPGGILAEDPAALSKRVGAGVVVVAPLKSLGEALGREPVVINKAGVY